MTLEPNRDQLEVFIEGMLRHCGKEGVVSLRAFYEGDSNKSFRITPIPLKVGLPFLMEAAEDDARRAANNPIPVVFCPPVATFRRDANGHAREEDLFEAPALSVELDQNPHAALDTLSRVLGPATLVVRSGGEWTDPATGEVLDKLHAHWRLKEPACGKDNIAKLKHARRLATVLVGGDPSNVPACHPIRWPGSWHRKAKPRLCEIVDCDHLDNEIDLDDALAKLEEVTPRQPAPAAGSNGAADAARDGEVFNLETAVRSIVTGENFHPALTPFAASLARHNVPERYAVRLLRALLDNTQTTDPERLARRDTERGKLEGDTVRTAYEKFAPKEQTKAGGTESLDEWDAGDDPGIIEPRPWLLGNQFCRGFVSSVFAGGGTGKTSLRLLQFVSLALGRSLCGQHVFHRSRVLVVSLEDSDVEIQRRIQAILLHYRIKRSELKGWLFCKAVRRQKLAVMVNRERRIGPLERVLREAIERRKPDIVALDPFVKTHGLAENDNMDMDFVADLMVTFAIEYNIAVDSPHHVHKGTTTPGDADSGRGGSGIKDAARLAYTLCVMSEDEAKGFSIKPEDRFSYVRVDAAKLNTAARTGCCEWFRLLGERLRNGNEKYPNGDEVQVAEPWNPPDTWAGLSNQVLNKILDDIAAGIVDENGRSTGERYSGANAATDRAVWPVVKKHAPHKTETQCRDIIKTWKRTGLLFEQEYYSPKARKEVNGLYVEDSKRHGSGTNCAPHVFKRPSDGSDDIFADCDWPRRSE